MYGHIMAKNVNEETWNLTQSLRETNQALAESVVAAQKRNNAFAQQVFENGIELLKSHAEATHGLMGEQAEQANIPSAFEKFVERTVEAQDRNMRYAQSVVESGTELLKNNMEASRQLAQTLIEQSQKQQEAFQSLAHATLESYMDFFTSPFSYYQQGVETAKSIALQGIETAQRITRQSAETAQKAAQQGMNAAQETAETY
jgi:hypothetical protein